MTTPLPQAKRKDLAAEAVHNRRQSLDWMSSNFYPEWEKVYQNYLCYRTVRPDDNNPSKPDYELPSVAMPDTWGWVSRLRARLTAQIPNIRFRTDDPVTAELISRTLMYQWDRGGAQKQQKKHVLQAALFGWSVKAWWWDKRVRVRRKRVDPFKAVLEQDAVVLAEISRQYDVPPEALILEPQTLASLLERFGRGRLLPVEYDYCAYEGPRSTVLFPGDCYPEPGFTSLQESAWFIVERRHDREWIENAVRAYPEFAEGFEDLLKAYPKGTQAREVNLQNKDSLYSRLKAVVGQSEAYPTAAETGTGRWTFLEMFRPGRDATWTVVAEERFFIGSVASPFDLDGMIPFTECVLVDNILHGVGDSTARVITPLQEMHNAQVSQRFRLVDRALRPNVFTPDRNLFNNPDQAKASKSGLRYIYSPLGAAAHQIENMGPALASMAGSLQDEANILRMIQVATGDSNMSMAANVDPAQIRTATGARLAAFNQDVLTKDLLDRYSVSLADDAEIMFMLNRSELGDAVHFEAALYNRSRAGANDVIRSAWVTVEPELFNRDGMLTVEVGSTLADDDEAKVQKAQMMFSMFNGHPLVNQEVLRDEVLTALGKGKELERFAATPQPPQQEEKQTDRARVNISLSMRFEDLPPEMQAIAISAVAASQGGAPSRDNAASAPAQSTGVPGGGSSPFPPPAPSGGSESALGAAMGRTQERPEGPVLL